MLTVGNMKRLPCSSFQNITQFSGNCFILRVIASYSFLIMDEKIRHELKIKKIREMKNPTILMHETDFEVFKKEVESKITVVVGENPTYQGLPIKTSQLAERGNIIVYDDVSYNWH